MLGLGLTLSSVKTIFQARWLLNADLTPVDRIKYVWVDAEIWSDSAIWKD